MKDIQVHKFNAGACVAILMLTVAPADLWAQDDAEPVEEVVVTGIRAGLQDALDTKRQASNIVDGISAEDIGKLPDENIAESLQRITGVSITRSKGEGQYVSVRGLSPDLVRVTINGRTATSGISNNAADDPSSESVGRRFSFDQLGSELVSAIEVYKTPTADLAEGGVAATVNIKTPRPFDFDGTHFTGAAFATYNQLSDSVDPRGSLLFSRSNDEKTLGFLASVSYSERGLRQDSIDQAGYQFEDIDIGGDGSIDFAGAAIPRITRPFAFKEDRDRLGMALAGQWAPSSDLLITADMLLTKFDIFEDSIDLPVRLFQSARTAAGALNVTDAEVNSENTLVYVDTLGADVRNDHQRRNIETQTTISGLNAEWQRDRLTVTGDLAYSQTTTDEDRERAIFDARDVGVILDFRGASFVPDVSVDFDPDDGARYEAAGLNLIRLQRAESEDEEWSFALDGDLSFDNGVLSSLEFGVQFVDRSKSVDEDLTNIRNSGFATDLAGFTQPFFFDDYLSSTSANLPRSWAVPDNEALRQTYVPAGTVLGENELADFTIEEEIVAGYLRANFDGTWGSVPFFANVGVRLVSTDQTSSGFANDDLVLQAGGIAGGAGTSGGAVAISSEQDYSDVLPSMNIGFNLREDLILRFAAAEVMTRPDLQSSALFFNINEANETVITGNANLDPFRASQFDVSLEWYFAPTSILSVAGFYKDIESFVTDITRQEEIFGDTFTVTRPINGEGAKLKGLELNYQQTFDSLPAPFNGLGFIGNYTYADSDANLSSTFSTETFSLEGLSKNTYNLIGFYENDEISVRLAYNKRSRFLNQLVGFSGNPVNVSASRQLDGSVSYNVNDRLSLSFEAINITEEPFESYFAQEIQLREYADTGRRFFFGFRMTL